MFITSRQHKRIVNELQERIKDLEQRSTIKDQYIQELLNARKATVWTTNLPNPSDHIATHGRTMK